MQSLAIDNAQMYEALWAEIKKRLSGITADVTDLKTTVDDCNNKLGKIWWYATPPNAPFSEIDQESAICPSTMAMPYVEVNFLFDPEMITVTRNTSLGQFCSDNDEVYFDEELEIIRPRGRFSYHDPNCLDDIVDVVFEWHDELQEELDICSEDLHTKDDDDFT